MTSSARIELLEGVITRPQVDAIVSLPPTHCFCAFFTDHLRVYQRLSAASAEWIVARGNCCRLRCVYLLTRRAAHEIVAFGEIKGKNVCLAGHLPYLFRWGT